MKLRFSKRASADIEEIYLYGLINFGEEKADGYFLKMQDCLDIIGDNPKIGRLDYRVTPAVRRFDFESHVIFYDVFEDSILVVRILHGAADFVRYVEGMR